MVSSSHCMEWDLRFPKNYKRWMVQLRWSVGLGVGREVEREGFCLNQAVVCVYRARVEVHLESYPG